MALPLPDGPLRVDADLIYDTKTSPGSPGVRAAVQHARRLLYTVDTTEVILQIVPDRQPAHLRLVGQILDEGMPVEGAAVTLRGPTGDAEHATDDDGEFRLTGLPTGSYSLDLRTSMQVVSVAPIDLG